MNKDELEELILQVINGSVTTIPSYLEEINGNKDMLKVKDPQEFVYGIIMGMVLGMGGAVLSAQKEAPTAEDQIQIRDIVYKHLPEIRKRIFDE